MRMSDQEYFRSCIAQERHLAQLLGHEVEEYYESAGVLWENTKPLPRWTRDWNACGPLLAEYAIALNFHIGPGETRDGCVEAGPVSVRISDHPNPERAVMYAIVKAVIHHLEHRRSGASRTPHR